MDLQHVTPPFVKPRHDDDLVAFGDTGETVSQRRMYLEPRIGCALEALFWGLLAIREARANHSDGLDGDHRWNYIRTNPTHP